MYRKCTLDDKWQEREQREEKVMFSTFTTDVDEYLCVFFFISFFLYICKNVLVWILTTINVKVDVTKKQRFHVGKMLMESEIRHIIISTDFKS